MCRAAPLTLVLQPPFPAPGLFGSSGFTIVATTSILAVSSPGLAALPAPVPVTTGTFTSNAGLVSPNQITAEQFRYMRVRVSNVKVVALGYTTVKVKGVTDGLVIDDGTGPMWVTPSNGKVQEQHLAGTADVYGYLNATTPGGLLVGDTISFINGVIRRSYYKSATLKANTWELMVPSPAPVPYCDSDYRSCGPISAADVGTVTRNGVTLTPNTAACTPANNCWVSSCTGGATSCSAGASSRTGAVAPPPPAASLLPVTGSIATKLNTQTAGTCAITDSCVLACTSKITSGAVYGTDGGNFGFDFYPSAVRCPYFVLPCERSPPERTRLLADSLALCRPPRCRPAASARPSALRRFRATSRQTPSPSPSLRASAAACSSTARVAAPSSQARPLRLWSSLQSPPPVPLARRRWLRPICSR